MAEAITLVKIFLFLGVIFVVSGLVLPGSDAAWIATRDQLAGQGFPTFTNPFDVGTNPLIVSLGFQNPDSNYSATSFGTTTGTANGCAQATFWKCVNDPNGPDGNATYYTIPTFFASLHLNITGLPSSGVVRESELILQCRSTTAIAVDITANLYSWVGSGGGSVTPYLVGTAGRTFCQSGSTFTTTRIPMGLPIAGAADMSANPKPPNLLLQILMGTTGYPAVQISTVQFTVTIAAGTICTGDFFGNLSCQIGQAVNVFFKALQLIGNVIVYVISIMAYALTTAVLIFAGIVNTLSFLISTLAVVPVLGPVLILVIIGCVIWFLYTFIRIAAMAVGAIQPV